MIFLVNFVFFVFYREKEMNEKYLRRIEEDQEREMRHLEEKIRKEVCVRRLFHIFSKMKILPHRNNKNLNLFVNQFNNVHQNK